MTEKNIEKFSGIYFNIFVYPMKNIYTPVKRTNLHELLADRPNLLAEGGGEHHNLLLVRGATENFLKANKHSNFYNS